MAVSELQGGTAVHDLPVAVGELCTQGAVHDVPVAATVLDSDVTVCEKCGAVTDVAHALCRTVHLNLTIVCAWWMTAAVTNGMYDSICMNLKTARDVPMAVAAYSASSQAAVHDIPMETGEFSGVDTDHDVSVVVEKVIRDLSDGGIQVAVARDQAAVHVIPVATDEASSQASVHDIPMETDEVSGEDTDHDISVIVEEVSPDENDCGIQIAVAHNSARRRWDKRDFCKICTKPQSKLTRHMILKHKEESEVAALETMPLRSKRRKLYLQKACT